MTTKRIRRRGRVAGAATKRAEPRTGLRERNKCDKLRRIKTAARKLFVARGFDDATLREIAAHADVGLGTVFLYAANKRDLLFLIVNEGLEEVAAAGETAVRPSAPLLDNLLAVFRHHYAFFGREPALSRLVLREMTFYETGEQARAFQKTRDTVIALLGKTVSLAMAHGSIASAESPQLVGWTIFCIFQVELRRWLAQDRRDLRQGLHRLRRTLKICVAGLQPTAPPRAVTSSR